MATRVRSSEFKKSGTRRAADKGAKISHIRIAEESNYYYSVGKKTTCPNLQLIPHELGMEIEEKATAIRSVLSRLKNGESKSDVFDEYRESEIRELIANLLSNKATMRNRMRFRSLNFNLVAVYLVMIVMRSLLFSPPVVVNLSPKAVAWNVILLFLLVLVPYMLITYHRLGYVVAIVSPSFYLFRFISHYESFPIELGRAAVTMFAFVSILTIALAVFLHIKLFPGRHPFGIKRNLLGDPIFED